MNVIFGGDTVYRGNNKMLKFLIDFVACAKIDDEFRDFLNEGSDLALQVAIAMNAQRELLADHRYPFEPKKLKEHLPDERIDKEYLLDKNIDKKYLLNENIGEERSSYQWKGPRVKRFEDAE